MPVGINRRLVARGIQFGELSRGEVPAYGSQILAKLVGVARANDHGGDRRPLQKPVERHLRHCFVGFFRYLIEGIDDGVNVFVGHPAALRRRRFGC
jgi:hypothetical protein